MRSCIFLILFSAIIICSCSGLTESGEGKQLATQYCSSCHLMPLPDDLNKQTWQEILPKMAAKMGYYASGPEVEHMRLLKANGLLPEKPLVNSDEWQSIQRYFLENAPVDLKTPVTAVESLELDLFNVQPLRIPSIPDISLIRFFQDGGGFYAGSAVNRELLIYRIDSGIQETYSLTGAPSWIQEGSEGLYVLTMGNIHPNDLMQGTVVSINPKDNELQTLTDSLSRPVHMAMNDLNGDGLTDIVVSGFGYLKGDLSWFEAASDGYIKHILLDIPGAIRTEVRDFTGDGNADILALLAQGDEGFFLFEGDGKGNFNRHRLLSFRPSFGSTYFETKDLNNDGRLDIIYTNGDNGDYSKPLMKPYHGVHIFLDHSKDGIPNFQESFFYHMNGPFKAMAEDYDQDGDVDIACISYFPDYERTPEEGFIYLENQQKNSLEYKAYSFKESIDGKWLTADRGDVDNDGDIDLILGHGPIMSQNVPDSVKAQWKKNPVTVMILENILR